MSTLAQYKDNLHVEAADLEKKLDRGENTPLNILRLEAIYQQLEVMESMKKPPEQNKFKKKGRQHTWH